MQRGAHFAIFDVPFGAPCWAQRGRQKIYKIIVFIMFLTPSLGPTWGTTRNIENCKTSATLHGSAPAEKKVSATLHGNAFAVWMVQMGPPKKASLKQLKPFVLNCFESLLQPI